MILDFSLERHVSGPLSIEIHLKRGKKLVLHQHYRSIFQTATPQNDTEIETTLTKTNIAQFSRSDWHQSILQFNFTIICSNKYL